MQIDCFDTLNAVAKGDLRTVIHPTDFPSNPTPNMLQNEIEMKMRKAKLKVRMKMKS